MHPRPLQRFQGQTQGENGKEHEQVQRDAFSEYRQLILQQMRGDDRESQKICCEQNMSNAVRGR